MTDEPVGRVHRRAWGAGRAPILGHESIPHRSAWGIMNGPGERVERVFLSSALQFVKETERSDRGC